MLRITAIVLLMAGLGRAADFQDSVRAAMLGSIDKQRESVRKQVAGAVSTMTGGAGFFTVPWPAPPQFTAVAGTGGDCGPMPKEELSDLVKTASAREGVSAELVQLVIGKESASKPCAVSPHGAQGLMQLMPATADELGVRDPFDARQNVDGGTRLLKKLLTKYNGDVALALGAYNAGSGRVDREGGIPAIPETINYVSDILSRFRGQ